ncbi:MAG: NCS2 family permease [Acidobacteria bacterium]|nr:NCS2 family permease [Acidobacteriota bacterium]
MRERLEAYFEFARLGTDWRTEILAGFTTFVTMAYIVFVNPSILQDAGMPFGAVMMVTCLSAAAGSILMGALARYPIALAPGMGLNTYFTYAVVKGMGVAWQTALGAVFLSGVLFFVLTVLGVRQWIVAAIPRELYAAVSAGVGLFIAFIGLRNAGVIVASPATLVSLGSLAAPTAALALGGLLLIAALLAWNVRGAMLIGILATAAVAAATGAAQWQPAEFNVSGITATAGQLDVAGALSRGVFEIVLVLFFVDLFDNLGTLVAVAKKAVLVQGNDGEIPRLNRILLTDATATMAGAVAGTSTVVSYIESAAGVAAGGRSGVTAIVTGLLFLAALFVAPLVGAIPGAATAPALIVVGSLMMPVVSKISWDDPVVSVPAFLTMLTIPLTFSIANGLALGFTAFALLSIARHGVRSVGWPAYAMTALLVFRFVYLSRNAGH